MFGVKNEFGCLTYEFLLFQLHRYHMKPLFPKKSDSGYQGLAVHQLLYFTPMLFENVNYMAS